MRIGIDARKLHDFGIGTYIRNLLRQLARIDHDTEYVIFSRPDDREALGALGANFRTVAETAGNYSLAEQIKIPMAIRREGVTLFHAPHYVLPPLVRCQSVVTIHDCIHLMFPQYLPNRLSLAYARTSISLAARRATRVLTVSESSKRDILRFVDVPPSKIDVIYNSYDERFGVEPSEEDVVRVRERYQLHDPFVLYAGNVKPHKNLERLIEAFHLVRDRGLDQPEARAHRRRHLRGTRRCAAPSIAISSTSTCAFSDICRRRRWRSCTGWPACSCFRRCTKGSACRRSRRWRAGRRSSRRTCRRCRKSPATPPCWSIRTTRDAIADGIYRVLTDERLRADLGGAGSPAPASSRGNRRCGACARSTGRCGARSHRRDGIAFVHDWLTGMRGGEKVLDALCERFPQAEVFTLVHVRGSVSPAIERPRPHTSFVQRLPFVRQLYRLYLPLFPAAVEQFDFDGFDLVVSTSHCCVKSVIRPGRARHLCYCLTPMRYAWDQFDAYFGPDRIGRPRAAVMRRAMARLARWDRDTAGRADRYVAISHYVAGRIRRYYNREATVVYPPVDTDYFSPATHDARRRRHAGNRYALVVSALVPYKRVGGGHRGLPAGAAFPLKIVGDGPERRTARARAPTGRRRCFSGGAPTRRCATSIAARP